ncbi:hypothetical protein AAMO2058_001138900, partial [Amorphochlora amoebiformis]
RPRYSSQQRQNDAQNNNKSPSPHGDYKPISLASISSAEKGQEEGSKGELGECERSRGTHERRMAGMCKNSRQT